MGIEVGIEMEERLKKRGYRLCGFLGEGGTARVFRVEKGRTGRFFACKVSTKTEWLQCESELLKSLRHPLFPAWEEYWQDGEGYLVMEYIAGQSLERHLRERKALSEREALRIALELADGLGYLHERGILYRDMKPSNIILEPEGRTRLLDLGAASVPEGWRAGTFGYAAPERLLAGSAAYGNLQEGPAGDVYSLGAVMHYMLTGRSPLKAQGYFPPVRKYNRALTRRVEDIVERCICEQLGGRIQGMRELTAELGDCYHRRGLTFAAGELSLMLRRRTRIVYEKNVWDRPQG